jgi:uncharacterized protein (DUF885 family)
MHVTSLARLFGFSTLVFAFGAGCASTEEAPPPDASVRLRAVVEEFFDAHLALNPLEATFIGDHRFDADLGRTASLEYVDDMRALSEGALASARAIDVANLSDGERVVLEVFIRERELFLAGLAFPSWLLPMHQMGSMALAVAELGSGEGAQPLASAADHDAWLKRAAQFPTWVDDAIARMTEGLARGVTQPRVAMQKTVAQLDALIVENVDDALFLAPTKKLVDLPEEERVRLMQAYRATYTELLRPAYSRLRDFLRDTYVPGCRDSVGWSALPDGERWYAYMVEKNTTTTLTPDEIHALGEQEVARIKGEMDEVRIAVGFDGDLPAFFAHLREDPKYVFSSPEELFQAYVDLKKRIDAALPTLFSDFPKADYEVRAVEAFRAASAAGAEYRAPSEDGSRPGIFYVNTHNLAAQPRYGIETLSLHEAAPGHHFQIAIQQELTHLPRFRRFADYNAYSEGWALYAESLGRELGLFQDPMQYYGRLNDEQLRAMRLVVDTGLHAKGWTRERAVQFMLDNSSLAPSDVEAEVDRYMVWPGQALGYKVGQFRIRAMRERAERELGAKFDVRTFHSVVLRDGAMPLDVLDRRIDRYIASEKVK